MVSKLLKEDIDSQIVDLLGFYTDPWFRKYRSYFHFISKLSKGKDVKTLYLPKEDMIEQKKQNQDYILRELSSERIEH